MRTLLTLLLLTAGMLLAADPPAPVYAILSVIGDRLETHARHPRGGGEPDLHLAAPIDLPDPAFDSSAVRAAAGALVRHSPRAEVAVLNSRSKPLYERQDALFAVKDGVMAIPAAVRDAARQQRARHLILISKYRDRFESLAPLDMDTVPTVQGLGLYVDALRGTADPSAGVGLGRVQPYVYIKVSLADVESGLLLGSQTVRAQTSIASALALAQSQSDWDASSHQVKLEALDRLLTREIGRVVPLLLSAAGR
jgi:hypothetical protein